MSLERDFVVTSTRRAVKWPLNMFKGETKTITIDFSPWAEDEGTVTAAVAAVKTGDAAIGNESLASNVKTMTVTTANEGTSMITVTATAGNNVKLLYIKVVARDPDVVTNDYGFITGT